MSRVLAFVLLFCSGAVLESVKLSSLWDPQIWGHLRLGAWILETRSWPRTGLFSQAANLPWRDFSWGYDVIAALGYRALGLRAVPALLMGFRAAVTVIAFLLAGGRRGHFWSALGISGVAQYVLSGMGPSENVVSAILFGALLWILSECRASGDSRLLFWLPVLFFLWANLDIGVVYGIGLYVLFLGTLAAEKLGHTPTWDGVARPATGVPLRSAIFGGVACALASMATPYGYGAYSAFFAIEANAANRFLPGYTAMNFRQPLDYALLLLTMAAFLALGIRRSRDFFALAVLIACVALSFHAQRENWLATLAAAGVIGDALSSKRTTASQANGPPGKGWSLAAAGLLSAVVLILCVLRIPRQQDVLMAKVAERYPVRACDFIHANQLPPPLFNSYSWGGFLTWYLPEYPVAIDARRGLYLEAEEMDYFKVMNAEIPYQSFPPMKHAGTLLLDKASVMGEALRGLPGFQVAYEDDIALVLLQQKME